MATLTVGDTTPRVQYTASAGQTVFAYGFPIFADADLKVYVGSTVKTLGSTAATSHYQVSGAGTTSGGNVTFGAGLTNGDIVTIYRDLAVSRATDFQTGGDLLAETLNDELDKSIMMIQQQERDVATRTLRFGQFVTGLPLNDINTNATDRANKLIGFGSDGQPIATQELGSYKGNWAASTAYVQRDIVKDSGTNNIFLANTAHTSSGSLPITSNTDSGKWDLLVDASSATTSATAAASSATAAASSASTATTKATEAESAASAVGFKFNFDNSTSMADPGAGDFRFNHATVGSVTAVAFDATSGDTGNPDISDFIATWDDSTSTINGHVIFKKSGTPATYAIFTVGAVTDNTGWLQVALTHVASNGTWSNADGCYIQFVRTGDKGTTGDRGSDAGLDMTFESATGDSDQGAGKVWFNNGTLSSATVLYMDDADANGADINSLVDSWDDSTTTALRGTIKVTQKASNAIFAIYNVTGAVTDASGYSKIAVTYVTGNGSFTDGDPSTVNFSRTGNTGATGSVTPSDSEFRIQDNSDATKQIAFEASSIGSGTTRTVTVPNSNITLVGSGSIVNADIDGSAAIALSKLASDPSNASNLASGTVPSARLGSGTASSSTFLRGDNSWQAISGGSLTKIATATNNSAVSAITFTDCFSATYDVYLITIKSIDVVSDSSNLMISFGNSDLSSLTSCGYRLTELDVAGSTTNAIESSGQTTSKISHAQSSGNITTAPCSADLFVYAPHDSATATRIIGQSSYYRANLARADLLISATAASSDVSFKLASSSGNIGNSSLNARVTVYGVSH